MITQVPGAARSRCIPIMLVAASLLAACGKSDPPPDLIKTQREALERAKAVSSVIEQSDQNARKQTDAASQ
jgi:major membrane immunogen (membrane-anchored lipoprotein)